MYMATTNNAMLMIFVVWTSNILMPFLSCDVTRKIFFRHYSYLFMSKACKF